MLSKTYYAQNYAGIIGHLGLRISPLSDTHSGKHDVANNYLMHDVNVLSMTQPIAILLTVLLVK